MKAFLLLLFVLITFSHIATVKASYQASVAAHSHDTTLSGYHHVMTAWQSGDKLETHHAMGFFPYF